jgi:hypothetical protein
MKHPYIECWDGKVIFFAADCKCQDCGVGYLYYCAQDEVWQAAGLGKHENVCIACLSLRLGHELTMADFTDDLCNGPVGYLKNQKEIRSRRESQRGKRDLAAEEHRVLWEMEHMDGGGRGQ